MKLTLSWLKEHLETDADLATIARTLTALGLEVEQVDDRAAALAPFTIARVLSAEKHPNADRLKLCQVETGRGTVQVVCGAPNARTGMLGVFAPPGTFIPGTGITLQPGVIRGVESNGMLCSERELLLSEDHVGIIDLPEDAPVGQPFAAWRGLDDAVIEIGLTPNRPDCTAMRGIARDLAAAGLGRLKPLRAEPVPGSYDSPLAVTITTDALEACPLFIGRHFRGLTNRPSPDWLQRRLSAVGLRPICALVDITNLMTLEYGRPLHVFDADRLSGPVTARLARAGETLAALNGREYALEHGMCVIADAAGAQSIAGVVGGEATGCTEATTSVFLECALFDPLAVAATGRRLQILSDARYRFERGVDPAFAWPGLEIATRLILELCGGEASRPVSAGAVPDTTRHHPLRAARVAALGGVAVDPDRQRAILEALGFQLQAEGPERWRVTPPSWRPDIVGEADLVEEILRVEGFDRIPAASMPRTQVMPVRAVQPLRRRGHSARMALAARGLDEAVTFSFMERSLAARFGGGAEALRVVNPISSELDAMRPSILPNLIQAARHNAGIGQTDAALFEVGPVYAGPDPEGQSLVAAALRTGRAQPRHWAAAERPADAFDARGDALSVLEAAGAPVASLQVTTDAAPWYHPGRSGRLRLGPSILAEFGELHPGLLAELDAPAAVGMEVWLDRIPLPRKAGGPARAMLTLPRFQPVRRDLAFLVPDEVPAEALLRAARAADKALITEVVLFDVYAGPGVEPGLRSLGIEITLQPVEATLTEAEIEAVVQKVVAQAGKQARARLRG